VACDHVAYQESKSWIALLSRQPAELHRLLCFRARFAALSAREQEALRLVEVLHCRYRDAAAALGIEPDDLRHLVFRARRKLYRRLN
jgi:DNA-directed RNA polymerase specialized sigma24 family protein